MLASKSSAPPGPTLVHQPVTDATGHVAAYTLHGIVPQQRQAPAAESAPDECLDAEYDQTDLASLAAGHPLLLQATRRVMTSDDEHMIADLPPGAAERPQTAAMVAWRHARGLRTSMAEFTGTEAEVALLPKVTMVSVDASTPDDQLGELIDLAHSLGVAVIAQEARTVEATERAFGLGADLVEGRVLPEGALEKGGLAADELSCLELLSLLAEDPVDQDAVIGLVAADPNLAIGVLHLVNSAVFGLPRPIDSVRQAVVMVGPRLLSAVATTSLNRAGRSDTDELWQVLARALACWDLAADDAGYTVGLLSAVADQRRIDPAWLAQMAGLSQGATEALVALKGSVGAALASVRAHEFGDPRVSLAFGIDPHTVSRAWLDALPEARGIAAALTAEP
ncbi:MAG: HDOD domain-containing protein [Micrococcales bacterium]|nr:HDOD domain-containing protein [Micrococcales bacterium]